MTEFKLQIERLASGHVRVTVLETGHAEYNGVESLCWQLEVAQDTTKAAQTAALKATFAFLNKFVVLDYAE